MSLPKPYYQDSAVTLYHGDCREIIPLLGQVDAVITDPPYGKETHDNATTSTGFGVVKKLIDFEPVTPDELRGIFESILCDGWIIATMEWRHVADFERTPPRGWRFLRFGVWVKLNGMPQLTGDRPAQGWEAIAYLHREGIRPKWNGGGRHGNFVSQIEKGQHPTTKPIAMLRQMVELFTTSGAIVLDPFAGSGTTGRACKDIGRKCVMIEREEKYCEIAARRMAQEVFNFNA